MKPKISYKFFFNKWNLVLIFKLVSMVVIFAQPQPCEVPAEMTPYCNEACIVCDIDGYQGRHESTIQGEVPPGFCTVIVHNAQWIAFLAGSTDLTVEIAVSNCQYTYGLEIAIYESLDCESFTRVSNCIGGTTGAVLPNTTAEIIIDQPLTIGQYYYLVMDGALADNCDWTFSVTNGTTAVIPLSSAGTLTGDYTVCPNITTEYNLEIDEGATNYEWTLDGNPIGSNNSNISIEWTTIGSYQLCVTASNACDPGLANCAFITVDYIEDQILDIDICMDETYFLNEDTELTESGNYEFNYTTELGCDSTIFVNLNIHETSTTAFDVNICDGDSLYIGNTPYFETGVYADTLQNEFGCDSIITLELLVVTCIIQGLSNETPVICHNESTGIINFHITNGTPPFTYNWQNLENTISESGSISSNNENQIISNLPHGTYLVTIEDGFGNNLILIQDVTQVPVLSEEWIISEYDNFSISCFGESDGYLEVIPIGGSGGYTYLWDTGSSSSNIENVPAGNYTVTVTDSYGCTLITQNTLTEPATFDFQVEFHDGNCDGLETGSIEIINVDGGIMPYEYRYNNEDYAYSTSFNNLVAGDYEIFIKDANGCEISTSSSINIPTIPIVELGDDFSILLGEEAILNPISNSVIDSFVWTSTPNLDCYDCENPLATPVTDTKYTLTVITDNGCQTSDFINISVTNLRRVFIPNVFTPNFDGHNDIFTIYGGYEVYKVTELKIYSRWGELLYSVDDLVTNSIEGWDGKYHGQVMNEGVYMFFAIIEFLDGSLETFNGDVTLLK